MPGNSTSLWELSPPSFNNLKQLLKNKEDLNLDFSYELTRSAEQNEQLSEVVGLIKSTVLLNETKEQIYKVINSGKDDDEMLDLKIIFRKIYLII